MKKRCVFLVGKSGDGKTATAYHILERLLSQEEDGSLYPFIVQKPEEIDLLVQSSTDRHYVVLVDDIFGISSVSVVTVFQKWKTCYFSLLESLVNNDMVYFIATSSSHIVSKIQTDISDIPLLSNVIDTTTEDYCLRTYEKKPMLTEYLEKYKVRMSDENEEQAVNAKLPIGFPQVCNYFVTNRDAKAIGPDFFQNPLVYLQDKITGLRKHNRIAYLVLVVTVFENGKLPFDILDPFVSQEPSYMKVLKQACGVPEQTTWNEIEQKAEEVCKIGYLVCNEVEREYVFTHQSVYDSVCLIFGKQSVQKVLEICPLHFLLDHTSLQIPDKKTIQSVIHINENMKQCFIDRLIVEIKSGSYRVLEHSAFRKDEFVDLLKKNKDFCEALSGMFYKRETVGQLINSRMLYYLTASKTDRPLCLLLVQMIGKPDVPGREKLLHDILEGACSSGDIVLFNEVMSHNPKTCEKCFLLAAESPRDQPDIMMALPKEGFSECQRRIVKVLVKKGRLETIKSISKSINWRSFHTQKRQHKLFNMVCLKGESKLFTYLQKFVPLPHSTDKLLVSAIIGKNKNIVKKLLSEENKEKTDDLGRTPLHHACYQSPKLCKLLVDHGVKLNVLDNRGATPFHMACQTMNKETMKMLLGLGFEVTITGHKSNDLPKLSPLHMVAQNAKGVKLIDTLISRGLQDKPDVINFPDGTGSTPLHIASRMPHGEKMIKALLKKGADTFIKDRHGKTALHIAAQAILPQNVEVLMAHYEDVNITDNFGRTPLHLAVKRKDLSRDEKDSLRDLVGHLMQKKADVNLADQNGNTAIHIAAMNNSPYRVFEILLPKRQKKAVLNERKESPIHLLFSPHLVVDTLNLLLEKYPKDILEVKTTDGKSLLHTALDKQAPYSVVKKLLEKTSPKRTDWNKVKLSFTFKHFSPDQTVHFLERCAVHFPTTVKQEVVKLLCSREMSDEKWLQGMKLLTKRNIPSLDPTLVHAVSDSSEKVRYLIGKGISVNAVDKHGTPLLHSLLNHGNAEGVKVLLGKTETDVSALDENSETALLKAVKSAVCAPLTEIQNSCNQELKVSPSFFQLRKNVSSYFDQLNRHSGNKVAECLSLLIKASRSIISDTDAYGNAAVHYASLDLDTLKLLEREGADLYQRGGKRQTCLHVACARTNNTDVVKYLLDKGLSPADKDEYGLVPLHLALAFETDDCDLLRRLYQPEIKAPFPFLHVAAYFSPVGVVEMFLDLNDKNLFLRDNREWLPIHCAVASGDLEKVKLISKAMKNTARNADSGITESCGGEVVYRKDEDQSVATREHLDGQEQYEDMRNQSSECSSVTNAEVNTSKSFKNGNSATENVVMVTEGQSGGRRHVSGDDSQTNSKNSSNEVHQYEQSLQKVLESLEISDGNNLLCFAASESNMDIVSFLLKEGFDINQNDENGQTPLHIAVMYQGGVEESIDEHYRFSEFHMTVEKWIQDTFEHLLKSGAGVNSFNNIGFTPLHLACTGFFPFRKIIPLLEHGASATVCSQETKQNALHIISSNKILAMLFSLKYYFKEHWRVDYPNFDTLKIPKILIDKGCSVNSRDADGQTPLHLASAAGNPAFVKVLLENEADINAVDNEGKTPLHRALEEKTHLSDTPELSKGSHSAALCLVEKGAELHAVVRCGETPCDIIVQLLESEVVLKEIQLICELYNITL